MLTVGVYVGNGDSSALDLSRRLPFAWCRRRSQARSELVAGRRLPHGCIRSDNGLLLGKPIK